MIDVVALLVFSCDTLVVVRKHGSKEYINIGGKREPGESDVQTLVREVAEEVGITLNPMSLSFFGQFEGPHDGTRLRITCYVSNINPVRLHPQGEIEDIDCLRATHGHRTTTVGRMILAECERRGLIH